MNPVISIITVVHNNKDFIKDAINSVLNQSYPEIEYIIIDANSTDGTLEIIEKYKSGIAKVISEPDRGSYDAMNKGIKHSTGDVIGFLHSDDLFADNNVIEKIAGKFISGDFDAVYSDIVYVRKNNPDKVIRHWKTGKANSKSLNYGWMPPHTSLFVKKSVYDKYGYFNIGLKIAADYDMILRFFSKPDFSAAYINEVLVKMRLGGKSNRSINEIIEKSREDYVAAKFNGLSKPFFTVVFKNLRKFPQFILR